jgi:hypothetical protein
MKDATSKQFRTSQIWSILVLAARHQHIITYGEIEKLTGLNRRNLRPYLDSIDNYCRRMKYPPLWSIVVKKMTRLPASGGMSKGEECKILSTQQRVFAFNWFSRRCPALEEFE